MKIKRVEPIAVSLPMKKPVFMAGVEIRAADNVLVRIEADDGVVGWGEAASAPTMTGETVESMMAAIAYLSTGGRGSAGRGHRRNDCGHEPAACTPTTPPRPRSRSHCMTLSAVPPAGRPMRSSAASRGAAWPSSASSARASLPPTCARPRSKKAHGYAAFKIKVGIDKPLIDAERTRRICGVLGRGAADLLRRQPGLEHGRGRAICPRGRRCRA